MPNFCDNTMTITGLTRDEKSELVKQIEKEKFLTQYAPIPEELEYSVSVVESMDEKRKEAEGYAWWAERTEEQRQEWLSRFIERKEVQHLIDKYGVSDGFNWCCVNWGTKWDLIAAEVTDVGTGLLVHFQTAWSPPVNGFSIVSKAFPGAKFELTYSELGADFCGAALIENGMVFESPCTRPSDLFTQWATDKYPGKDLEDRELNQEWYEVSGEYVANNYTKIVELLGKEMRWARRRHFAMFLSGTYRTTDGGEEDERTMRRRKREEGKMNRALDRVFTVPELQRAIGKYM